MAVATIDRETKSPQWARNYPPLAALVIALVIALAVLPSSLNLPQTNPTTTLEFAPVPPDDDSTPPVGGNVGSLGLGSSGGLTDADPTLPGGEGIIPEDLGGEGKTPRTKECVVVNGEAKQTEDPLAPPCVADFKGDNGGSTYLGVTREEVRILVYVQRITFINGCRDPNQTPPEGYVDLAQPPEEGEHCINRILRNWQTYFNTRYQTYGRFVHFFAYFANNAPAAEQRKADAADNFARIKPFAVLSYDVTEFADAYITSMSKRGAVVFDATPGREAEFFAKFPGLIWGYQPTLEVHAKGYVEFLCKKVAGKPVTAGNNPADRGKPRKYGLVYTSDKGHPELRKFKDYVKAGVAKCDTPIEFAAEAVFPYSGFAVDSRTSGRYAQTQMADFQRQGITTIIWPGGMEAFYSKAGARIGYRPEVIIAGDGIIEGTFNSRQQDQSFWQNAVVVTPIVMNADVRRSTCYIAYRETDPDAADVEVRATACELYTGLRQMFTGIQVAGPKLSPKTMDRGYHAIPAIASNRPDVPACFYEPGDYTCVKDQMWERWDPAGSDGQGCYRAVLAGRRFFAEVWPGGNVLDQAEAADPCNAYDVGILLNTEGPDPDSL